MFKKGCVLNCKHYMQREMEGEMMIMCRLNAFEECIPDGYSKHEYYIDDRE